MDIELLKKYYNYPVNLFDNTDSTNAYALKLIKEGAEHGTIVAAESQTQGRGRMGRKFYSPRGGLYMSLVLDFPPERAGELTTLCAVATANSVKKLYNIDCSIKWVNDLLLYGKKFCGILCEGIPQLRKSVAGIGINIGENEFPADINAVSLNIPKEHQQKERLCADIALNIINNIPLMPKHMEEYRKKLSTLEQKIYFTYKGTAMHGIAKDVDDTGALLVETSSGIIRLFSGEVSVKTEP
ncbi:MAG: biotin--[acetyl-CoA-carboxylase] ligase [Eubacteriales bacterium]|nr:biotin--[acetyl-CoA-carboxylase] ligase [Eubacteriales bacterium]